MKNMKKISLFVLCTIIVCNLCLIQVEAKSINPNLNKKNVTLTVGKTTTLKLNGANVKKWSSSNKAIATVSSKGKITAKKEGSATVTVKATNGNSYKCKVTVKEGTPKPEQPSSTYSASEVMSIVESTLRGAGFQKPTDIWDMDFLEGDPTAGMGWVEFNASNLNSQTSAKEILEFYTTNGYNMYYLESSNSTIKAYYGTR